MGKPWFWGIAISILFLQPLVRTFLRERPKLPPVGEQLPTFALVRETGQPFGSRELSGKVWVASFLANEHTPDSDNDLTAALVHVQRRLRHMGDSYRLVSFTVDAAQTPEQLSQVARGLHANPRAWCFVGGDPAELARVSAALHRAPDHADAIVTLIDQQGRIRGTYDPRNQSEQDALVATLGLVVNNY